MMTLRMIGALFLCLLLAACGGGGGGGGGASGGTSVSSSASGDNVATVVVDGGPAGMAASMNALYVTVTVCVPGTSNCQAIDHVLVDSGSYGLRIIGATLDAGLTLPQVTTAAGLAVGECTQFATGYTWGSVRQADIRIAGEIARGLPIQVISDPSFPASVPGDCRGAGTNWGTMSALGAKGILGVGLFIEDCGSACVNRAIAGTYYACNGSSCTASTMPLAKQVANPIASFAVNNNGVLLQLPAVPAGGAPSVTGSLIFGIGTQANNQPGSATAYAVNAYGNFTTTYNGRVMTASFLDSGSNALFFTDASLLRCTQSPDFYCPSTLTALTAVNSAYDNSASGTVNFSIENLDTLPQSILAAAIGGDAAGVSGVNGFDWGLPFFFGRSVFVAIEGKSTPKGMGPYWAY